MLVFRDITHRLRDEAERRKAESVEQLGLLAGGIAHDFNNLLTAIIGNISLISLLLPPDDELGARLKDAQNASNRARDLAQQLLTFARGGSPIKQTASAAKLIQDTVSFSLRGARSGAEVTIALDLWPAEFDSGQISQFIANLVVNADQAMPEGGTLRVGCDNFVGPAGEPNSADNLKPGEYIRIKVCGRRFDVVILDLTLPGGMGGKDALKALLEIDPMVNAIFSSGYAPDATMSRYEDLGFRGVIAKPYEAAALGRKVHETIESGRLDTESVYELQHAC